MRPVFGNAPREYDVAYLQSLIVQLNAYIIELESVRTGRFSKLNISQLPTSAVGLRTGDVWNDGGTLKIV